jgi:Cytochrome c554 and c-prime
MSWNAMGNPGKLALAFAAAALLQACSGSSQPQQPGNLTREELLDPQSCQRCHQEQYADWAGSMHAYSSQDPVMRAMNKRGQRETNGTLGKFCVNCHAPMAVREGATTDGLNLDQVPQKLRGVTCFFCHATVSVDGTHDNPLKLGDDGVMYASISDPVARERVHGAAYSPLLDRNRADSAAACGACHDIVAPHGGFIERTFSEWKESAFATATGTTCGQCHMPQSTVDKPVSSTAGAPLRRSHSHTFAAVDTAITPFPDTQRQRQEIQALLDTTLQSAVCAEPFGGGAQVSVIIDNAAAGHAFPSGSAQDRRLWIELIAYRGSDVVYQSGVAADDEDVTSRTNDPDLWLLRDCMFDGPDASGKLVHMFWEAASVQSNLFPALTTFNISDPTFYQGHKIRYFPNSKAPIQPAPDRITLRARLRPVGLDVLDDLIASGDLDPQFRSAIPVFNVGGTVEWTQAAATHTYLNRTTGGTVSCATNTNINVQADKFPAPVRSKCAP